MSLFGYWLCEACVLGEYNNYDWMFSLTRCRAFVQGRARAYGCLCRIICQRCAEPVANEHLVSFYRLIHAVFLLCIPGMDIDA